MANPERQKDLAKNLQAGKFTIRDWREQLSNIMGMGSLSKIASMIPGMPAGMMDGNEEDTSAKLKRMVFITDAMRQDELDSDGLIFVRDLSAWQSRLCVKGEICKADFPGQIRQKWQPDRTEQTRSKSCPRERYQCERGGGAVGAGEDDVGHGQAGWRAEWMVCHNSLNTMQPATAEI